MAKRHKKSSAKSLKKGGAQRFGPNKHSSLNVENGFVTPENKGGKKKHKRGRKRG